MNREEQLEQRRKETEHEWLRWIKKGNFLTAGETVNIEINVNIVREPIVNAYLKLSPAQDYEQFGRRNCRYFTRELTSDEIDQIREVSTSLYLKWPQKLIALILEQNNRPMPRDNLIATARKHGYKRDYVSGVIDPINILMRGANVPYRLHAQPGEIFHELTSSFRFYRKAT